MPRIEVALRSPIAFLIPSSTHTIDDILGATPDTVGIHFEGRTFHWHPPRERKREGATEHHGPMVVVTYRNAGERGAAADALQRFLSAVAFAFDRPAEDVHDGGTPGSGESDPLNPSGPRAPQAFPYISLFVAPASIEVAPDHMLGLALAYYREGLNAGSPFYRFLAFWNVLAAVFGVEDEQTSQSDARDDFIRAKAMRDAWRARRADPVRGDVASYLREDARNAIAHVIRPGRREIHPDAASERVRLSDDARSVQGIARAAVREAWPEGVRLVPLEVP